MSKHFPLTVGVLALFAQAASLALIAQPARTPTPRIGTVQQPLVNGSLVSDLAQEELGLLTLNVGSRNCSASLLRNSWVITASHCIDTPNPMGGGFTVVPAATVTLTGAWKTVQMQTASRIVSFRPLDVALIQLAAPFVVNGSAKGFRQEIWGDGPFSNLKDDPIEIYGRGINQFASGSTPSRSDGLYRYGNAVINEIEGGLYWYPSENGLMIAGGDSGGPSFVTLRVGRALTGVHALCDVDCVQGQACGNWKGPGPVPMGYNSWMWASATPRCADAPIEPVWYQIARIMGPFVTDPEPALEPPPPGFIGTFGTTPRNYQPMWVYAIKNDGDLLWYRKDTGAAAWQGPKKVGNGWSGFRDVIPAGGNSLYALTEDGFLKWYQHEGFNDGSFTWKGPTEVGNGWRFAKIFSGGEGVIYAIKEDGTLMWYRHAGYTDGVRSWAGPNVVGSGWGAFKEVFSTGRGAVYAVRPDGDLVLYQQLGFATGNKSWTGPRVVGSGWGDFRQIVPVGDGVILAIKNDGKILWYKHLGRKSSGSGPLATVRDAWEGPVEIGSGWTGFKKVVALMPVTAAGPR
ncbi:MAG: tachylectin-related carbohydrate-binding protein [Acidobacteriota bacterium]